MSTEIPKTLNLLDPTPPAVIAPPVRTNLPDVSKCPSGFTFTVKTPLSRNIRPAA